MGLEHKGGVNHLALTRTHTRHFCQHIFTINFTTKAAITHTLAHSRNYQSTRWKFIKSCVPQQSKAALWSTRQESKQGKPLFLTCRVYCTLLEPCAERGGKNQLNRTNGGGKGGRGERRDCVSRVQRSGRAALTLPVAKGCTRMFSGFPSVLRGAARRLFAEESLSGLRCSQPREQNLKTPFLATQPSTFKDLFSTRRKLTRRFSLRTFFRSHEIT